MSVRARTLSPRTASFAAGALAALAVLSITGAAYAATDTLRDPDWRDHPMTHQDSSVLMVRFAGSEALVTVLSGDDEVDERSWSGNHHGLHFELRPGTYTVAVTLDGMQGRVDLLLEDMVRLDVRIEDGELVFEATEGHMMGMHDGGMQGGHGGMHGDRMEGH